jgi:hypothetical protein
MLIIREILSNGDEIWVNNNLICIKGWQDGDVMGI